MNQSVNPSIMLEMYEAARNSPLMIPVYENYKDYQPPHYAHTTVEKLLSSVPQNYLSGLQSVVLTNGAAIGKGKTGRVAGKKYARSKCLGFYHPARKNEPAWIEIIVDNIVDQSFGRGKMRFLSHLPVARKMAFADTLFHELGHHLDYTIGAPAPAGEQAAEAWKKRLTRSYFRKRYWHLVPFLHRKSDRHQVDEPGRKPREAAFPGTLTALTPVTSPPSPLPASAYVAYSYIALNQRRAFC